MYHLESVLLNRGITFVRNSSIYDVKDVLIVPYLIRDMDCQEQKTSVDLLVVSGVDSLAFNSDSDDIKKNALMQMSTSTVRIEVCKKTVEVVWVDACFISENMIRFIIADNHGKISLHDYDTMAKKDVILVNDCQVLSIDDKSVGDYVVSNDTWFFDTTMNCEIDNRNGDAFMIVIAKSIYGTFRVCWFNIVTLQKLCMDEVINIERNNTISRILCLKAINSPQNSIAVALGIETSETVSSFEVVIVQCALLSEVYEQEDTKKSIANPQIIFRIPIINGEQMELSKPNKVTGALYAEERLYSFTYRLDNGKFVKIMNFEAGDNDEIGKINVLLSSGMIDEASRVIKELPSSQLLGDFGSIHISEITLWKFKHLLSNATLLSKDIKDQLKDIFRSLAGNAVSGGELGKLSLIRASQALRNWPISGQHLGGPQIRDFRMVMSAMQMNIANAMKLFDRCKFLKSEAGKLEAKIDCLKCIEELIDVGKEGILLGQALGRIDNVANLYSLLIRIGVFNTAELVRKYDANKNVGQKQIGAAVLHIPYSIHPHNYSNWLQEVAIPSLVFNNESIEKFQTWCCKAANFFDLEESFGIDASILLLEVTSKAIINSSVDKYVLFASHFSTGRRENNIHCCEETINMKLIHATLLKNARKLGLPRNHVSLTSFREKGGADFIAKDLIRISCEASNIECFSKSALRGDIEKFCSDAGVSFDDAVGKYAEELCASSNKNFSFEESSGLARLCSDPEKRCQIALKVLHAVQFFNDRASDFKSFSSDAIDWAQLELTKSELKEVSRLLVIDEIVRRYCGAKAAELFRVSDEVHSYRLLLHVTRYIDIPSQLEDVIFLCDSFTHLSKTDACLKLLEKVVMAPEIKQVEKKIYSWKSRNEQCETIILSLLNSDVNMTIRLALKLCSFCSEMISHLHKSLLVANSVNQEEAKYQYLSCCTAITSIESTITEYVHRCCDSCKITELEQLQRFSKQYERLRILFIDFGVILSLSDLSDRQRYDVVTTKIIKSSLQCWMQADSHDQGSNLKLVLDGAMKGAMILCDGDSSVVDFVWCKALVYIMTSLINSNNEDIGLKIIEASEIWNETQNEHAYDALVVIAIKLCSKISQSSIALSLDSSCSSMRRILIAKALVQEHLIMHCSEKLLSCAMFLHNTTDILSQVITRADCGVGEEMEAFLSEIIDNSQSIKSLLFREQINTARYSQHTRTSMQIDSLHPTWYVGDGILLPPTEASQHCMHLFRALLIARSLLSGQTDQSNIYKLHEFLHSRGAYAISSRILMYTFSVIQDQSSSNLSSSSRTHVLGLNNEINYLLAERSLGSSGSGNTCGRVDSQLAVYHLLSLPLKVGFKVRKHK